MNLADRKFKNNLTGEVSTVIDSFENIAILNDNSKASVTMLLNENLYTEIGSHANITNTNKISNDEVDVTNFFQNQNAYNSLANRIKNIPIEQMGNNTINDVSVNDEMNIIPQSNIQNFIPYEESIIEETTEEDAKEELAKKYGIISTDIESMNKQKEAFSKFLDEEDLPVIPEVKDRILTHDFHEKIQRIEVKRPQEEETDIHKNEKEFVENIFDPIIKMFQGVKRNLNLDFNIEISEKIPRLDFIEMMEDSYETSIIDFLSNEFAEKLLKDPEIIKSLIKEKIMKMVYASEWSSSEMDKLKEPVIKGTMSVSKSSKVNIDSDKKPNAKIVKEKRAYKKKNKIEND